MAYTGSVPLSPERETMKRATYEDVLNAPENKVAEILDGELVLSPRPALRHARAASRLGAFLGDPFDRGRGGPGGWTLLDEPELHLGEHVVVPDIAGWRLREGAWTILDVLTGKATVRAEPFDAIELELGALWPDAG